MLQFHESQETQVHFVVSILERSKLYILNNRPE